jgi:hypothetical protein
MEVRVFGSLVKTCFETFVIRCCTLYFDGNAGMLTAALTPFNPYGTTITPDAGCPISGQSGIIRV